VPVLFVSHSSKDDSLANSLEEWLRANGITDVFVDHHDIAGGDKWHEKLRESAGACRVIVCLVTEHWLASHECYGEFVAACYLGKRIVPLFLLPPLESLDDECRKRLGKVRAEDQGIELYSSLAVNAILDLDGDRTIANRLKEGLRAAGAIARIGLDPRVFPIDRVQRPMPFPGLASFGDDDADAALFFGRSREIAAALEDLRKIRAERDQRPFVILGASGAGKSSLLKAGLIPRLRREAPAWLQLRAFRPGANPILNFAEALSRTLRDYGKVEAHGVIRDRLVDAWSNAERVNSDLAESACAALETVLEAEGCRLRDAAGRVGATILISVDQAEEMVRADDVTGDALADYLRIALAASKGAWQLAFTIRADSLSELLSHRRFQNLEARSYDLRAIPKFRFDSVVEEPAKLYGVEVAPDLIDALMDDAPEEDALPLLAFALQRLWRQYAVSGTLTTENYRKVSGLRGLIEDAAERALRGIEPDQDVPRPTGTPPKRLNDLGAATFVPGLAQVSDQGATIRRVADWTSFNEEQQDLLDRFDRWRLVVRKGEAGGGTVEVAHEALFREWMRLKSWLEPERGRLDSLRSLQVDASTWDRNGRNAAFLNHRETRLGQATTLVALQGYRERLGELELSYIKACVLSEQRRDQQRRRAKALVASLTFGVAASLIAWVQHDYLEKVWRWWSVTRPYMQTQVRPFVLPLAVEVALKPGQPFKECAEHCPEMVVIPAGHFEMGSLDIESGHQPNEGPRHPVTFSKPFAISKFAVTFDDWDACTHFGECAAIDESYGRGQQPAINVSWNDAQTYVKWWSEMTGKPYRLLSEAEYEYAARAGEQTAYPWGNVIPDGYANCKGCGSEWDNNRTAPVDSFAANQFGLYQMTGNIWEWVGDCWNETYKDAPTDGALWLEGDCSRRVARGGSWDYPPEYLRTARRSRSAVGLRVSNLGFRIGRTLTSDSIAP
jgi:formylglycine-generating enzyme required for sulfatase activity